MNDVKRYATIFDAYKDVKYFKRRRGRCYELSGKRIAENHWKRTQGLLVHGFITGFGSRIAHAWVIDEDGAIWEPASGLRYHPEDFVRIFSPEIAAAYTVTEAAKMMVRHKTFGAWDDVSLAWYDEREKDDARVA